MIKMWTLTGQQKFAGGKSLDELETIIQQSPNKNEIIDVQGVTIPPKLTIELARMMVKYHCTFINLGMKADKLNAYIDTYYFIKENTSVEDYADWIINLIKQSNYSLMIKDNRLSDDRYFSADLELIQPLTVVHGHTLRYKKLKSRYTEPSELQKAVKSGAEDVWEHSEVSVLDLHDNNFNLRFPASEQEMTIVQLFMDLLMDKPLKLETDK